MKRKIQRHRGKIQTAAKLYVKFRGEEPEFVETVHLNVAPVMLLIGELDGVLYTTRRDGKRESYIHKFKKNSRPLLASSHDGKTIYIIGGRYEFGEAGIIDR